VCVCSAETAGYGRRTYVPASDSGSKIGSTTIQCTAGSIASRNLVQSPSAVGSTRLCTCSLVSVNGIFNQVN